MIRVTLELIPKGDESKKVVVGHLLISNDDTGTPAIGNYDAEIHGPILDEPGHPLRDQLWSKFRLEGFRRNRGLWSCVKEALNETETDYDLEP